MFPIEPNPPPLKRPGRTSPFIFIHIPKTGAMVSLYVLAHLMGKHHHTRLEGNSWQYYATWPQNLLANKKLIGRRVPYSNIKGEMPGAKCHIPLRKPYVAVNIILLADSRARPTTRPVASPSQKNVEIDSALKSKKLELSRCDVRDLLSKKKPHIL